MSTKVKIVRFAPIPRARVMMAMSAKIGRFKIIRTP